MALYVVGDVQGCCGCLENLLKTIEFHRDRDRIWFAGDIVNRGPQSLSTLRLVRDLNATMVLGNHDLHLLAVSVGARPLKQSDTFADVLQAGDRDELLEWLIKQPLMVRDEETGWHMVHAGLIPQWSLEQALCLATEVHQQMCSQADSTFFAQLYGDQPDIWSDDLVGEQRTRFIVNTLTRMRYCDAQGRVNLEETGPPGTQPKPFLPWFDFWQNQSHRIVFGHWSTLGAAQWGNIVSTDSGCAWGARLTAVRLDPEPIQFFQTDCSTQA